MKKIFFTGTTGFIGKNVIPFLREKFEVIAPCRGELDLKSDIEVREYLKEGNFDAVIHAANPNPAKNKLDTSEDMLNSSLRLFMNFFRARDLFEKLIYLGSGAEYDKTLDICDVTEEECFRSVPKDSYGFAKYIMNSLAAKSDNVYNLCLFACYGPYDHSSKFIIHCINCCLKNEPITIRQDCVFDYLHVYDLAKMMIWMVENNLKYHIYNASSGTKIKLSEIAEIVQEIMKSKKPIKILSDGLNNEYTANVNRFKKESGLHPQISLKTGIEMLIEWERENYLE